MARHGTPMNLKLLAAETKLHPSTAHRILSVMVQNHFADRIEPGTYRLGMRLLELGTLVRSRISIRQEALPWAARPGGRGGAIDLRSRRGARWARRWRG